MLRFSGVLPVLTSLGGPGATERTSKLFVTSVDKLSDPPSIAEVSHYPQIRLKQSQQWF